MTGTGVAPAHVMAQPYFAAFMRSIGLPQTFAAAQAFVHANGNLPFMEFMWRAKAAAPRSLFTPAGSIADHRGWAAHVQARAEIERAERQRTCAKCDALICDHTDAQWRGETPSSGTDAPASTSGAGSHGPASFSLGVIA